MTGSELQGPTSLRGTPNCYSTMFFICLILLVLLPCALLSSTVWLEPKAIQLEGRLSALTAEIDSLQQQIAVDANDITRLENEVLDIARAEQVFSNGSNQGNLWGPDTRWSDMGRARVEEIWRRRAVLRTDLTESGRSVRRQTASLADVQASRDQITFLRTFVADHKVLLYAVVLFGVFATGLFALLWSALIQARVNAILSRWAHNK